MIFASKSFSLSRAVGYRDLLEVVQEHTVFKRPSMVLLRVSVRSFVSFVANFCSVYGFPVMMLPMALTLSSSLDNVQRFCKDVDSSSSFLCVFLGGHQTLTASAVKCPFGMLQANRTLGCSDSSAKFVQLNVAHLFELALWFIAEHIGYASLFQVFDDGLVAISVSQSINEILHLSHPLLVFVDVVWWYSMNSKIDLKRASFFRSIVQAWGLGLCPQNILLLQLLLLILGILGTIRGAGLGVEDRW